MNIEKVKQILDEIDNRQKAGLPIEPWATDLKEHINETDQEKPKEPQTMKELRVISCKAALKLVDDVELITDRLVVADMICESVRFAVTTTIDKVNK